MYQIRSVVVAAIMLLAACSDDVPLQPISPDAINAPGVAAPVGPAAAAVALAACTHHWATGTSGAWFTPGNWNPATVPGAGSTACIDAAGTYTVTLDPSNDATPVDLDGLSIGGGATGAQTLLVKGVGAIVNASTGVDVKASGVFSLEGYSGVVVTAGAIANAGTVQTLALCGGCGSPTVQADLDNSGTLRASTSGFILGKVNGVYHNTGTIDVVGTLTIPATAGSPSFTLESGSITSTAGNPGNADFRMLAGTFTYNGGDALSTTRGLVTLEGVNLVFGPSPAGTAAFSMLPSAAGNTFTGNIGATQTVRMPLVGGAQTMVSRTLTLVGDVVNNGTLELQQSPATGFPILAGTGTLLNKGTLLSTGTGNDSARIAINLRNEGTITSNGRYLQFDQPSLIYVNAGTIAGTGTLRVNAATLTNEATAHLNITSELRNAAHLRGTGTNTTSLRAFTGSTVDPGFSPGILTVGSLQDINGGILKIELGGETAGTGYDQIQAAGQATLSSGTLNVSALNGFLAGKCGQVFDIILHNSPGGIGQFATITGLDQGGGRQLKIIYGKPAIKLVGLDAGKLVAVQPDAPGLKEGTPGAQYYVCLGVQPNANVTITPTPDAQVTVSPASLTFTSSDWELPKAFTIQAIDDQAAEGDHTGTVTHAVTSTDARFAGFALGAVTANIADNDINHPPVAGPDQATTPEDTPVSISVLGNDSDSDTDPLTVTAATAGTHGTTQITDGGTKITYTPAANFNGPDAFNYTLSDGRGGTANGSVTIDVSAVNDLPVAGGDNAVTRTRKAVVITVLANDADADQDALSITQVGAPAHGSAVLSGGGTTITYRSVANYVGGDQVTYTISDGHGGTANGTVDLNVVSATANTAPVAAPDFADINNGLKDPIGRKVRIQVLDNDTDAEGDNIKLMSASAASRGTVLVSGRSIVYTITNGAVGSDFFTYVIQDALGATATGNVQVTWDVLPPTLDYSLGLWNNFDALRALGVGPRDGHWFFEVAAQISGLAPATTTVHVEWDLPAGIAAVGIGSHPGPNLASELVPGPGCTIGYVNGAPRRYICDLIHPQGVDFVSNTGFSVAFPQTKRGNARFDAKITPALTDPNKNNNKASMVVNIR